MTIYEYGNPDADTVLIQLTGDHELSVLKNEVEEIRKRTSTDFRLIAAKVDDWNYELSPWKAPAVFGNEDFGDGAVRTLEQILTLCTGHIISGDILLRGCSRYGQHIRQMYFPALQLLHRLSGFRDLLSI
jgi:hypothetical protein